jgi:ADP-dependent NAD(P)H-hydrate dehydratase
MNADLPAIPARQSSAHKGDFGRVLLIGGSRGMAGSIALSGIAALRTGSGLVSLAVPDRCLETVASFHPALMTIGLADDDQGRFAISAAASLPSIGSPADAIAVGPGMTRCVGSLAIVQRVIEMSPIPRVFDADALNLMAEHQLLASIDHPCLSNVVLTPHPGELHRLTGVSPQDRDGQIAAAVQLSSRTGAVVVVKGGPTVVVWNNDQWTNDTGNPGMATAGSGDVLTGMIASLMGQGLTSWDAARLGVHQHGAAGDRAAGRIGMASITALDIANDIRMTPA